MRYKGDELQLADVRSMFATMEHDMEQMWEEDVLLRSGLYVKYPSISEDLSNRSMGYSFLQDLRNPFAAHRTTLANHILQTPWLHARFVDQSDGQERWYKPAMIQWLLRYAELSLHHLLRCEMLSGGPPRGTELTAMLYRSTKGRDIRNLAAIGQHLVMLCTYSKTTALRGTDRLIPHSLDSFESDLLVQDLVLARPFAELAVHVCWPDNPDALFLYQHHLFVNYNKLFVTKDISDIMARYTTMYLSVRLTIQDWRHISIAWRRKLCPTHIEFLEDGESADHVAAEQTGHSVQVERLKYAISAEALAGPSEDVLPLFLQASGKWQQQMEVVPGT